MLLAWEEPGTKEQGSSWLQACRWHQTEEYTKKGAVQSVYLFGDEWGQEYSWGGEHMPSMCEDLDSNLSIPQEKKENIGRKKEIWVCACVCIHVHDC